MRAVILRKSRDGAPTPFACAVETVPRPSASSLGHALIALTAASLNRREIFMQHGLYPRIRSGSVIGGDGCGRIVSLPPPVSVGAAAAASLPGVPTLQPGDRVVLNPSTGWSGIDPRGPPPSFLTLGMLPQPGTFAEFISLPADRLERVPPHLSDVQAASLPTAGLTAFRAVTTRGRVARGDLVLISGIGGGVALFALQIAVALGARVLVTSSSADKIARAVALGAEAGFLYSDAQWPSLVSAHCVTRPIDCVIDGSGGAAINDYIKLVRIGGCIVSYGATAGLCDEVALHALFLKNVSLLGSTMGSDSEFRDFIRFVDEHKLVPVVEAVFPLERFGDALQALESGQQFGKVCLAMSTPSAKL